MRVTIRAAKPSDIKEYTSLLQRTYESAYTNDSLGLTKECFSQEVFNTADTQKYLLSNLVNNSSRKAWLAFIESQMVGSVTIKKKDNNYEITGFYVTFEYQGRGIGKQLWNKAFEFSSKGDILVDLYVHNKKSVAMYKKWGFVIDKTRGENGYFYRHWQEWPDNLKAKCMYMRLIRSKD